jgi:hypothetical protein
MSEIDTPFVLPETRDGAILPPTHTDIAFARAGCCCVRHARGVG